MADVERAVSDDEISWRPLTAGATGRYVSLSIKDWQPRDASLAELDVSPSG